MKIIKTNTSTKRIVVYFGIAVLIMAAILFCEVIYQKGKREIEAGNYYIGAQYLNKIGFYRQSGKILADKEVKLAYAIETLDCSDIDADSIEISKLVNHDAVRACFILDELNMSYSIKYIDDKESGCNKIVSVNKSKENIIELTVNDYYGLSKETVNYCLELYIHVAERGEYIYIASEGNIYKTKADLKEKEVIYRGEDSIIQISVKGNYVYFTESVGLKHKLVRLNTINNEVQEIISKDVGMFIIVGNKLFVFIKDNNGEYSCWDYNISNMDDFYKVESNKFIFRIFDDEVGYFKKANDEVAFKNILTQETLFLDTDGLEVKTYDTDNNILMYKDMYEEGVFKSEIIFGYNRHNKEQIEVSMGHVIGSSVNGNQIIFLERLNGITKLSVYDIKTGKRKSVSKHYEMWGNTSEVAGYTFSSSIIGIYKTYYNVYTNEFAEIEIGHS